MLQKVHLHPIIKEITMSENAKEAQGAPSEAAFLQETLAQGAKRHHAVAEMLERAALPAAFTEAEAEVILDKIVRENRSVFWKKACAEIAKQVAPVVPSPQPSADAAPEIVVSSPLVLGRLVPGKGIYTGTWEPKDRDGRPIGQTFNVFAAPTDLTDSSGKKAVLTYNDAVKELGHLRNWHGHDGGTFKNDTALYEALKNGTVPDQWFTATRELLCGKDVDGNDVRTEHLLGLHDKGDFKGTFNTTQGSGDNKYHNWYLSCTEHRDDRAIVWATRLPDGDADWINKALIRLSSRPCRVELAI